MAHLDWKAVGREAVKHPWESGLLDIGVGTLNVGVGVVERDPMLAGLGLGLAGIGASRMTRFARKSSGPGLH